MLSNIFISFACTFVYLGGIYILSELKKYYTETQTKNIFRIFLWPLHFFCIGLFVFGWGLYILITAPLFILNNLFEGFLDPHYKGEE